MDKAVCVGYDEDKLLNFNWIMDVRTFNLSATCHSHIKVSHFLLPN